MDNILHLSDDKVIVNVFAYRTKNQSTYEIRTYFADQNVKSGREYNSAALAMSDARTLFYLLNGISELMNLK
jgi:hypothetical protein